LNPPSSAPCDDDILERLLTLNLERAAVQATIPQTEADDEALGEDA
jgi:hypothetical protein